MTEANEILKTGLYRRFGVAKIIGSSYFDYEQFALELRKRVESPYLDWEVPTSPKEAHFFATCPKSQVRAIKVIEGLFGVSEVLYFYCTIMLKKADTPSWSRNLVADENLLFDRLEEKWKADCRTPEVIVWVRKSFHRSSFEFIAERLRDACVPNVRLLEIDPVCLM
ncbi:TPA: hypothetical protein DEP58_02160 [Patescibacteria group bacterium]|nr:MAG: hypothetical protein UU98_C0020G0015 [Parcubacteria group bacterium GW2011_GWD2_42_14]HCC05088.1 hypothetical protein [Patescibacteria group bacterium]